MESEVQEYSLVTMQTTIPSHVARIGRKIYSYKFGWPINPPPPQFHETEHVRSLLSPSCAHNLPRFYWKLKFFIIQPLCPPQSLSNPVRTQFTPSYVIYFILVVTLADKLGVNTVLQVVSFPRAFQLHCLTKCFHSSFTCSVFKNKSLS
jgi:hypothetical protein